MDQRIEEGHGAIARGRGGVRRRAELRSGVGGGAHGRRRADHRAARAVVVRSTRAPELIAERAVPSAVTALAVLLAVREARALVTHSAASARSADATTPRRRTRAIRARAA